MLPGKANLAIGAAIIDARVVLYPHPWVVADVQIADTRMSGLAIREARAIIDYRDARPEDGPALAEMASRCFVETFGPFYKAEDMEAFIASAFGPEGLPAQIGTPGLAIRLAVDGGRIAGFAKLGPSTLPPAPEGSAELKQLYRELPGDPESRQLLQTYLDGRFPVWREDEQSNGGEGLGVAPGAGAMTKEEAYKILGLEAGAAAADVRKAHRRLMQRLHPDIGGTSFLAARINEAKDVLLSNHN